MFVKSRPWFLPYQKSEKNTSSIHYFRVKLIYRLVYNFKSALLLTSLLNTLNGCSLYIWNTKILMAKKFWSKKQSVPFHQKNLIIMSAQFKPNLTSIISLQLQSLSLQYFSTLPFGSNIENHVWLTVAIFLWIISADVLIWPTCWTYIQFPYTYFTMQISSMHNTW